MNGSVLDRESIARLLSAPERLVEGYLDLEAQLQPNGFDLTLKEVRSFESRGEVGHGTEPAVLSETKVVPFDSDGGLHLSQGSYLITLNEVVHLPNDIMALARPRSSLLRSGVAVHTAVWDAGYPTPFQSASKRRSRTYRGLGCWLSWALPSDADRACSLGLPGDRGCAAGPDGLPVPGGGGGGGIRW